MRTFLKSGEAASILEVSPRTARDWAERYGLGRRVGGQLRFDPEKVDRMAKGEINEELIDGARS